MSTVLWVGGGALVLFGARRLAVMLERKIDEGLKRAAERDASSVPTKPEGDAT